MKLWQHLELWGASAALVGLLLQFFVIVEIQERRERTDANILSQRLTHIYLTVKNQEPDYPAWKEIERYNAGPKISGDGHFQFSEVENAMRIMAAALFLLGSFLAVAGKRIQFKQ